MLNEIKVKNVNKVLGGLKNKLVGSNKSKANLSIIDRIRKYYLELAVAYVDEKLEKLETEQKELDTSINAYENDLNEALSVDNNKENIRVIDKNLKKEQIQKIDNDIRIEKLTEKYDNMSNELNAIYNKELEAKNREKEEKERNANEAGLLDQISKHLEETANEEVAVQPIEINESPKEVKVDIDTVSKNLEAAADKVAEEEKKAQDLAADKINDVKDNMIEMVTGLTTNFSEDLKKSISQTAEGLITSITTLVQEVSVGYENEKEKLISSYEERLANQDKVHNEKLDTMLKESEKVIKAAEDNKNKIVAEKDKEIAVKDTTITDLTNKNNTLTVNLENANTELAEKNNKINELDKQIAAQNATISEKDADIAEKDKEIARLRVFEQKWQLISQAMTPVQENTVQPIDTTKTL